MAREAMNYNDLEHMLHQDAEPRMINFLLLKEITDNFFEERKIGSGGFGDVYMGVLSSQSIVAVKRLSRLNAHEDRPFQKEVECLMTVKHRNIARFLGYCASSEGEMLSNDGRLVLANVHEKLLCFEYLSNGNLRNQLKEKPHRDNWPARYKMIRGICEGLHYLHDKQIIHRDLKPENVMLDAQMEPKITDFGLSRFLDQGTSTLLVTQIAGTRRYSAPETIDKEEVSLKSDIYALGVTMVELLSGISMISLWNQWDEYIDTGCPRARGLTKIARNCMDSDKHKRPTISEVIRDLDNLESTFPWSSISQSRPMRTESTVVKLPARSLTIAWVHNSEYWRWIPHPDARSGECVELLSVYYLKVSRLIAPKDLPAATANYTVYLVYRLAGSTSGLKDTVQTTSTLHFDTTITTSKVSLHPKAPGASGARGVTYPVTTGGGWLELRLGEFSNEKAVTVQLLHEDPHNKMSGLIIDGMEIRRRP